MALDLEGLRNKKARRSTKGWSPKEGDNLVRFLPHTSRYFTEDLSEIAAEFTSHFLTTGEPGTDFEVVRCLKDRGEACGFCEAIKKYKESADPVLKKTLDQIRRSERHLFNLVDLNNIGSGVQTYESGPKLYDDILAFIANPAWGDLLHPEQGRNFTINLTPKGKTRSGFPEYRVQPHPDRTDITAHLPEGWKDLLDAQENSIPNYPDKATVARWLDAFGLGTTPVAAPVPAPVPAAPAPAPVPVAPAPVPVAPSAPSFETLHPALVDAGVAPSTPAVQAAAGIPPVTAAGTSGTPVATFSATHGVPVVVLGNKEVPACYSRGPSDQATGYNPARFPCDKGCPEKANCQLTKLGLG